MKADNGPLSCVLLLVGSSARGRGGGVESMLFFFSSPKVSKACFKNVDVSGPCMGA